MSNVLIWLNERGKETTTWVAIVGGIAAVLTNLGYVVPPELQENMINTIVGVFSLFLFFVKEKKQP